MTRKAYPSDLNDTEWDDIKDPLPPTSKGSMGNVGPREIINAIFNLVDNSIMWRAMPHSFPPRLTVYTYFLRWKRNGLRAKINTILLTKVRLKSGYQDQPSLVMIDYQAVEMI
jgi:putative transposase